jgi:hypothetical protein
LITLKDQAHATLNGGKTAEIKLKRFQGMTDEPGRAEERRVSGGTSLTKPSL